jgi:methanogenic corrinoid protein MtbC1
VRANRDPALEPEDEVLAVRLDRLEPASVDPLGHALRLGTRVRGLRRDALADEHLEASGRQVQRVALGHVSHRSRNGQTRPEAFVPSVLNISALTQRTGVPSDTIRKWEQRYGVLHPRRSPGGQRRYSELDVERIEWLKARIRDGYRIGEAAALLGDGASVAHTPAELRDAIVAAAQAGDVVELGRVVDQTLALSSLDQAFHAVLEPALVEVGERWAGGEVSVAHEHLASATVRTALQTLLSDPRPDVRGTAVLACAPGEQHEIGLLMLAVLLRSDGWQVAYLGANTPLADAIALADSLDARVLCLSTSLRAGADEVDRALAREPLRASLTVFVGGRGTENTDLRGAVTHLRELHR